jgi:hypothetical protein
MKINPNIALVTLAVTALPSTVCAQTLVWSDNFDDNNLSGWTQLLGPITEVNQQFVTYGGFGPFQTNTPLATHAAGLHSIPTSGPLPDNQTLELRADLIGTSENDAWAGLVFNWLPQGQGYAFFKDQDEVAMFKFYNGATSFAFFFYENHPLPNEVSLVLALTCRGSNVEITTRVLDKDNANAVLFERTLTDTPQADPVLPDRAVRGTRSEPDVAGTPWPVGAAPGNVELSVTWVNSERPPDGYAAAIFDNLEVRQYESPELTIQRAVVLSWPVTSGLFILECASSVDGPWDPVPAPWWRTNAAQNEVCILAPDSMKLFRLRPN